MVIYAIVGVSLVVLTGWAGQISLGQFAISGVGAAVAGGLAANHGWDFFAAVFAGGLAGAAVAVLVGLPALRIQGLFLAITTLSFAFVVAHMLNRDYVGWLLPKDGQPVLRPNLLERIDIEQSSKVGPITLTEDAKFYWLCLAFLGLAVALARSLRKNRSGRIFIGVRDNGRLMQAFGVNLARTRIAAFALSGFLAGDGRVAHRVPEPLHRRQRVPAREVGRHLRDGGDRRRRLGVRRDPRRRLRRRPPARARAARPRADRLADERRSASS